MQLPRRITVAAAVLATSGLLGARGGCHLIYVEYPRFLSASPTPSRTTSWILHRSSNATLRRASYGPKLGLELRQEIGRRHAKGETPYAIAKALGIDRHTAAKYAC
jgi:hypothetical protein